MRGNVLIMAAGTGGHVFPALACAQEFKARGYTVHWLGTSRGIENELVPAAGFALHQISVSGLRGKNLLALLKAPLQLLMALLQARRIVRELFGHRASGRGCAGGQRHVLHRQHQRHGRCAVAGRQRE